MDRKQLHRLLLLLLAVNIAIFFWGSSRELNVENFSRIKFGMTQGRVESLLGGPPGHYGNSNGQGFMTLEGNVIPSQYKITVKTWNDKKHYLEVYFDPNGRVVSRHKRSSYSEGEGQEGFISRTWKSFCSALDF